MKGIIINFDDESKTGLILSENGVRYPFKEESINNKKLIENKSLNDFSNLSVDFIFENETLKDIYIIDEILKKAPESIISSKKISKLNYDDFNLDVGEEKVKKVRKESLRDMIISPILTIALYIWIDSLKRDSFWTFPLFLLMLITGFGFLYSIFGFLFPKNLLYKVDMEKFKQQLIILDNDNIQQPYKHLSILSAEGSTYDEALSKIIKLAFDLKADALINFKQDLATSSNVKTSFNSNSIHTKINKIYTLQASAISI